MVNTIARFLAAIKQIESGGDYNAQNPHSSASGAYQFIDATWKALGGSTAHAKDATPAEQDRIAAAYAARLLKKYRNDAHKAARAWNQGEPKAERDASAGAAYASRVVALM